MGRELKYTMVLLYMAASVTVQFYKKCSLILKLDV